MCNVNCNVSGASRECHTKCFLRTKCITETTLMKFRFRLFRFLTHTPLPLSLSLALSRSGYWWDTHWSFALDTQNTNASANLRLLSTNRTVQLKAKRQLTISRANENDKKINTKHINGTEGPAGATESKKWQSRCCSFRSLSLFVQ